MPRPLAASSTITSSIHARKPVGIGNIASARKPTIRPSSFAASSVVASDPTMSCTAAWSGCAALVDSCGSRRRMAAVTSSFAWRTTSTSTPTPGRLPPGSPAAAGDPGRTRRPAGEPAGPGHAVAGSWPFGRRFGKTVAMTRRALVLGAGGEAGIAWEVGLLAGLAAHGVDLAAADLVVGTSAGALAGAQVTSGIPLAELYQAQCAP